MTHFDCLKCIYEITNQIGKNNSLCIHKSVIPKIRKRADIKKLILKEVLIDLTKVSN